MANTFTPINAQILTGAGGIWWDPFLEKQVVSLIPAPARSILRVIPTFMRNVDIEKFAYLTGSRMGTDPRDMVDQEICSDCAPVGDDKNCFQKAPWGFVCLESKKIFALRYGMKLSNADIEDELQLINPPPGLEESVGGPTAPYGAGKNPLTNVIAQNMRHLSFNYIMWLHRTVWHGHPSFNTFSGIDMTYGEPYGFLSLINTNHVDERTSIPCPPLDSEIVTWGLGDVTLGGNPTAFIRLLTSRLRRIWDRAMKQRLGMNPSTDWVLSMRDELFYALTRIWPCVYQTTMCGGPCNNVPTLPATTSTNIDLRMLTRPEDLLNPDNMYTGGYLVVSGVKVPVVVDDMLPEVQLQNGLFRGDIVYLPLRFRNQYPAAYVNMFNFGAAGAPADMMTDVGLPSIKVSTSDAGRFMWTLVNEDECFKFKLKNKPQVVLRLPQLAMRIMDIDYCVDAHTDDVWPGQPYHRTSGVYEVGFPENQDPFGYEFVHKPMGGSYYPAGTFAPRQ